MLGLLESIESIPIHLCSVCKSVDFENLICGKAKAVVEPLRIPKSYDLSARLGVLRDIRQCSMNCSLCRLISTYVETKRDAYLEYQLGQWSQHKPGEYPMDKPI